MRITRKILILFFAPLLALSLVACEAEQGPAEEAGEAVDNAVEEAGDAVEEAGDAVQDATGN